MGIEDGHPAFGIARELFGADGWEIVDALERDGEAVVVDLRRHGTRQLFVAVARDGRWERPGLVSAAPQQVPAVRRPVTRPGAALAPVGMQGSGWPGPDGQFPDALWVTVNGFAASDVEAVELSTDLDRHEGPVQDDGSFLALVRARRREQPRIRLQLNNGEHLDETL